MDQLVYLILAERLLDIIDDLLGLKRQDNLMDLLHVVDCLVSVLLLQTLEHHLSINLLLERALGLPNSRDLLRRTQLSWPVGCPCLRREWGYSSPNLNVELAFIVRTLSKNSRIVSLTKDVFHYDSLKAHWVVLSAFNFDRFLPHGYMLGRHDVCLAIALAQLASPAVCPYSITLDTMACKGASSNTSNSSSILNILNSILWASSLRFLDDTLDPVVYQIPVIFEGSIQSLRIRCCSFKPRPKPRLGWSAWLYHNTAMNVIVVFFRLYTLSYVHILEYLLWSHSVL